MTPQFALSLSQDGIALLMRGADGWRRVGLVGFGGDTMAEDLSALRDKGAALAESQSALIGDALVCKLVIPDDQIRFLMVDTGPLPDAVRRDAAAAALEGATPYAVSELAFDIAKDGSQTCVAAVARETLQEAESFARAHGFAPIFSVAAPLDQGFATEPFFGPSEFARTQNLQVVAPLEAPLVDIGPIADTAAPADAAPEPVIPAEDPAVLAPVPTPVAAGKQITAPQESAEAAEPEAPVAPGSTPDAPELYGLEPVSPDLEAPELEAPDAAPDPLAPETADQTKAANPADAPETVPQLQTPKLTLPAAPPPASTDPASTAASSPLPLGVDVQVYDQSPDTDEDNLSVGFSSRRRGNGQTPDDNGPAAPTVAAVAPVTANAPTAPAASLEPPAAAIPAAPMVEGAQFSRRSVPTPHGTAHGQTPAAPPVTGNAATFAAARAAASSGAVATPTGQTKANPAVPAAMAAALSASLQDSPAVGTAPPQKKRPRRAVLAAAGLVLAGLAAALWMGPAAQNDSAQDATESAQNAPLSTQQAALQQDTLQQESRAVQDTEVLQQAERASELRSPSYEEAASDLPVTEAQDLAISALPAPRLLPSQGQTAALPELSTEAAPQNGWTGSAEALSDPAALADAVESLPQPTAEQLSKAAQYAATGIWQEVPRIGQLPSLVSLSAINVPAIDPSSATTPAAILPAQTALATDEIPGAPATQQTVQGPTPEGASPVTVAETAEEALAALEPERDARGLIIATEDGVVTPDGVRVVRGRPEFVPPEVPDRLDADALAAQRAAEARAELGRIRPRVRPAGLVPEANDESSTAPEDTLATEIAEAAAASEATEEPPLPRAEVRPRLRPSRLAAVAAALADQQANQQTAEADAATERSGSRPEPTGLARSALRPRNRPSNMAVLVDRAQRRTAASNAIAASVAPTIPSSASVARQATETDVLNLRKVNLIGIYGTSSNRRALVRLPSGRYVKVKVGDRIDGGRIVAIGEEQLRYQKGGRNTTLKMPRS